MKAPDCSKHPPRNPTKQRAADDTESRSARSIDRAEPASAAPPPPGTQSEVNLELERERERTRRWVMSSFALVPLLSLVAVMTGKLTPADVKELVASFGLTQLLCLGMRFYFGRTTK